MRLRVYSILFFLSIIGVIVSGIYKLDTWDYIFPHLPFAILLFAYLSYHNNFKTLNKMHLGIIGGLTLGWLGKLVETLAPEDNSGGAPMVVILMYIFSVVMFVFGFAYERKEDMQQGWVARKPAIVIPFVLLGLFLMLSFLYFFNKSGEKTIGIFIAIATSLFNIIALNRRYKVKTTSFELVFFAALILNIGLSLLSVNYFFDNQLNIINFSDSSMLIAYYLITIGVLNYNKGSKKKSRKSKSSHRKTSKSNSDVLAND